MFSVLRTSKPHSRQRRAGDGDMGDEGDNDRGAREPYSGKGGAVVAIGLTCS
jgi:hypothetical protein